MKRRSFVAVALACAFAALPAAAQQGPIKIAGLVELSGTGTTSGTNFNDGVKLAVKEINAAGGILGRKVEYTANDTQSQPQTAKALAVKAIDDGAYVVMGPVFSGSILVSMAETKRAEIPNFTGGEAAAITEAKEFGGRAGLHSNKLFERQARPARAVAAPMRQHKGRHAGIDDRTAMRAAVAEAQQRRGIGQHLADRPVIVDDVVRDREEQEAVETLGQIVVGDFLRARVA